MFDKATKDAANSIANRLHIEPAALLAVAEVESNGQIFALVDGRPEPVIRWEGHYFDQRLKGAERELARSKKLASPKAGAIKNPNSQAARWAILAKASAINRQAALESISVGLGQVMIAHWNRLAFSSAEEMLAMARRDAAGQIELMARFVDVMGLADELKRKDFAAFARGYNGAAFRKNKYDVKMAAAYRRLSGDHPVSEATGMLRMGSHGAKVRELQTLLVRAGYAVHVDGDFGPGTRDAVRAFQRSQNVEVDGVAGPKTFQELEQYKTASDETPGAVKMADVDQIKTATVASGGLALATQFRDQISETASYLSGTGLEQADTWSNYLLAGAAVIGVGLAVWGLLGWLKSRRTVEGDVEIET